jgi:hypothetical protein
MLIGLHTRIEPLRLSVFLALGLLGACGDSGATTMGTDSRGSTGTTQQTGTDGTTDADGTTSAPTTGTTIAGTTIAGTEGGTTSTTDPLTGTGESTALGATTLDTSTGDSTTGDSTTGDSTSTGGSSTDTDGPGPECVTLMQGMTDPPVPSGWVKCGDQLPHRVEPEVCLVPATPATCQLDGQECKTNDDCNELPFGSCQQYNLGLISCGCSYGCETDADCDPGFVCRCAGDILGPTTRCVESKCSDDGDCGDEVCQFSQSQGYDCGPEVLGGACSTPNDLCETDAPCFETPCAFIEDQWACSQVACGRPFMVDDHRHRLRGCARRLARAGPGRLRPRLRARGPRRPLDADRPRRARLGRLVRSAHPAAARRRRTAGVRVVFTAAVAD